MLLLRGDRCSAPPISLGLIITFIGYVQRFNQPIQQISVLWANLQSAVAGAERIFELLDTAPDVQDKAERDRDAGHPRPGGVRPGRRGL